MIAASPSASSVWVRAVDEGSGAVFEQEVTADLPASNQFLAPRLFMNNGATAAAVPFQPRGGGAPAGAAAGHGLPTRSLTFPFADGFVATGKLRENYAIPTPIAAG